MKINAIYPAFDGEVNPQGIGEPVVVLRLQGCHIRCYKKTLGVFCDTPEALNRSKDSDAVEDIANSVLSICRLYKIGRVLLTGGDPLWNDEGEIKTLLKLLSASFIKVNVETSGTLKIDPYFSPQTRQYVKFVLDYKLPSAGIKAPNILDEMSDVSEFLEAMRHTHAIKFVCKDLEEVDLAIATVARWVERIYNSDDGVEVLYRHHALFGLPKIAIGLYYGSDVKLIDLMSYLLEKKRQLAMELMHRWFVEYVCINAQLHNLAQIPGEVLLDNLDPNLRKI